MLSTSKKIILFLSVVAIGSVTSISTFPLVKGITPVWPASAVQAVAGLLFGVTGVIAGTVFPILSNIISGIPVKFIFLFTPSNFVQSFLPFMAKKIIGFTPLVINKKTVFCFILFCVVIPDLLGAIWASNISFAFENNPTITLHKRLEVFLSWLRADVPSGIIFGLLLLRTLAPALESCGLYDDGKTKKSKA